MAKFYEPLPEPYLEQYVSRVKMSQTEVWDMKQEGLTVPTEKHLHALLWFGRRMTEREEFPIIVVVRDIKEHPNFRNGEWWCGIGKHALVAAVEQPVVALYEMADMIVTHPDQAVEALQTIFPDDRLTAKVPELQLA